MATIGTLQRLSATSLSKLILAAQEAAATTASDLTLAVIDVRDDDYIGGHIKGARNVPSRTLDAVLPTLVRQLHDKETVVFHCALSQQRGPAAALRYLRERERVVAAAAAPTKSGKKAAAAAAVDGDSENVRMEEVGSNGTAADDDAGEGGQAPRKEQKVYVLDRGFVGWQEVYGMDERLTEGYRKELWQDGYWG